MELAVAMLKLIHLSVLVSNKSLLHIFSQSSGDSDLIGVEENPEFSPYSRNGKSNDGFTPDFEIGRRASINPVLANGYGPKVSVNPLSAAALHGITANPMASGIEDDDFGYENGSRRSSINSVEKNKNFTLLRRMDSAPSTEL
jgi:hypothetical protein